MDFYRIAAEEEIFRLKARKKEDYFDLKKERFASKDGERVERGVSIFSVLENVTR